MPCCHADGKEKHSYQTSSHQLFFPFVDLHNAHARMQLPNTLHVDNSRASAPNVGRAEVIRSLLPTSMPSKNNRNQMSPVVAFEVTMPIRRREAAAVLVRMV